MNDQTDYDRDHVHAQLPGHHLQVTDGGNFAADEGGDAYGRVPVDKSEEDCLASNNFSTIHWLLVCRLDYVQLSIFATWAPYKKINGASYVV